MIRSLFSSPGNGRQGDMAYRDMDDRTCRSLYRFLTGGETSNVAGVFCVQEPMVLTHLPLVLHICVNESGQHWFR